VYLGDEGEAGIVVRYLHSVLEHALPAWLALGWAEFARDYRPSVAGPIVLIEWASIGEPIRPDPAIVPPRER
jgi:hypothetical protein